MNLVKDPVDRRLRDQPHPGVGVVWPDRIEADSLTVERDSIFARRCQHLRHARPYISDVEGQGADQVHVARRASDPREPVTDQHPATKSEGVRIALLRETYEEAFQQAMARVGKGVVTHVAGDHTLGRSPPERTSLLLKPSSSRGSFVRSTSEIDVSVNWVKQVGVGQIEARYVRRKDDYFALYLSSQTGCRQGCRMCHLTATKQTALRNVTLEEFSEQAEVVLTHYRDAPRAKCVHYNFMARGEALSNPVVVERSGELFDALYHQARAADLAPRFLVSTILPKTFERSLAETFDRYPPEIYYSLYSMNAEFRQRWLPKALPVADALDRLAEWQRHSYKIVKIHYAFIAGENDSEADVHAVCDALIERGLYVHVNIVRYNPPNERCGEEPAEDVLQRNAEIFRQRLPMARVRVIPRVGFDVYASCGMFVS